LFAAAKVARTSFTALEQAEEHAVTCAVGCYEVKSWSHLGPLAILRAATNHSKQRALINRGHAAEVGISINWC
jgi:hypothetical protein